MLEKQGFSNARKKPLLSNKIKISINIDRLIIEHFKDLANQTGIPYQTLINSCLKDYVSNNRNFKLPKK